MANNNTIELIGNMNKKGIRIIETKDSTFAVLSLATTDSYKNDKTNEWHNKETIWHNLITFNPEIIEILKGLNTKARIKVTGTLSYRPFPIEIKTKEKGKTIKKVIHKNEASIIVKNVEQIPLVKKSKDST